MHSVRMAGNPEVNYGSAVEIGEILDRIAQGKDVWIELWNRVLHQGKLYDATIPVATWRAFALDGTV